MTTPSSLSGLTNQFRRESGSWWNTRRWWTQALVWSALTNALVVLVLWVLPRLDVAAGTSDMTPTESAVQFAGMAGILVSVGVVVTAQGILLDERRSGVLEWMLSKPLARSALLAAKFLGHALALFVVIVLVPWLGVLAQLSLADGALWPLDQWLGAVALIGCLAVFHLAVVLMLSALTWSRALVVALPLAGILGTDLLVATAPRAFEILPWSLARIAGPVLSDGMLMTIGPLISTAVLTVISLAVASLALKRTEL
ncbi:ABC transporter permease [Pseudactinotalea sp. Z1748]|uniref:ABC transporter permease n=1 Tax=Pseudactinotalea sp. Z1748 TaxID=3413027 RepID=UPI003C7AC9D2